MTKDTNIAFKVESVSKKYKIGKQKGTSLRESLSIKFKYLHSNMEEFHALKNLNFDILKGDVVGIIGKNGAGKSTLLKVLSQITKPSKGKIEINGRIAALLEVGTGFHPELTGRENIFLNGTILGMTRKEVRDKFDEIVAFSGVEKFIDTPVKHYSSGMYVRLAFAVAAHLETEILIIDEVLAVGDAEFQKKCLGKMHDVANDGRTVIFVSHNMAAVKSLCNKSIVLKEGEIAFTGSAKDGIDFYNRMERGSIVELDFKNTKEGNDHIRLLHIQLLEEGKNSSGPFSIESNLDFVFQFQYSGPPIIFNLSLVLKTLNQEIVFNVISEIKEITEGHFSAKLTIPKCNLNNLIYTFDLYFVKDTSTILFSKSDILNFEMIEETRLGNWYGEWIGLIRPTKYQFTFDYYK